MLLFPAKAHAEESNKDCLVLIGDSRCYIMQDAIRHYTNWNLICDSIDRANRQGYVIFENDSYYLIISTKSGGSLVNGDADLCWNYLNEAYAKLDYTRINNYSYFNLYGVNDMPYIHSNALGDIDLLDEYINKNLAFINSLDKNFTYYQCTIGQINDEGSIVPIYNNDDILYFNQQLLETDAIPVYDIASSIKANNLTCLVTDTDPYGVHYSEKDSLIIFDNIFCSIQK